MSQPPKDLPDVWTPVTSLGRNTKYIPPLEISAKDVQFHAAFLEPTIEFCNPKLRFFHDKVVAREDIQANEVLIKELPMVKLTSKHVKLELPMVMCIGAFNLANLFDVMDMPAWKETVLTPKILSIVNPNRQMALFQRRLLSLYPRNLKEAKHVKRMTNKDKTIKEEESLFWFLFGKLKRNGFRVCDDTYVLYYLTSSFNHSCSPSALNVQGDEKTKSNHLVSARPIKRGEEVTISYHPYNYNSMEMRRRNILKDQSFLCACLACAAHSRGEALGEHEPGNYIYPTKGPACVHCGAVKNTVHCRTCRRMLYCSAACRDKDMIFHPSLCQALGAPPQTPVRNHH